MLGPKISGIRGKTLQHKPYRLVMYYVAMPRYFLKVHKFVTLVADVMFVIGAPLLITMPISMNFLLFNTCLPLRLKNLVYIEK